MRGRPFIAGLAPRLVSAIFARAQQRMLVFGLYGFTDLFNRRA
jgi:hypothetical protein